MTALRLLQRDEALPTKEEIDMAVTNARFSISNLKRLVNKLPQDMKREKSALSEMFKDMACIYQTISK